MKESLKITGKVRINGIEVSNQITDFGLQAIIQALVYNTPLEITNMFILSGWPTGGDPKTRVFTDVLPYQKPKSLLGDITIGSLTPDLIITPSMTPPVSVLITGTLPYFSDTSPVKNGAALILNGDNYQSYTTGAETYLPLGSEILFAVVSFDPIATSLVPGQPFVIEWEIFLSN